MSDLSYSSPTAINTAATRSFPWQQALCWLPPLLVLALVLSLHIDVPYHDQWDLLKLLDASFRQQLSVTDLLQAHNGHILLLPQLVMLLLARLTHWNTLAEVLFSFGCMLINWQLLLCIGRHVLERPLSLIEQGLVSVLIFSLAQAQNWLWGWQLQIPLALLSVLLGLLSLILIRHHGLALLSASLCGIAASLSFAGSLPYWFAVIPMIWQRQRGLALIWLICSMVVLTLYARQLGVFTATTHSNPFPPVSDIPRHIRNTLAILGNLGARYSLAVAAVMGCGACAVIMQGQAQLSSRARPLMLSMVLFSLGSALLVSMMRAGLGDAQQMLATRYGTLTLPWWIISVLLLMNSLYAQRSRQQLICFVLLVLLATNSVYSLQDWQQLHKRMARGQMALQQIHTEVGRRALPAINPRPAPELALQEVALLQQYRLSFYRDEKHQQRAVLDR